MAEEKKREQTLKKVIKTNAMMFRFAWKEKDGKKYIVLTSVSAFINAAISAILTVIPGLIINELIGQCRPERIVVLVAVLSGIPVISHFINKWITLRLQIFRDKVELSLITQFYDFTMRMDYETLEKPDVQILRRRAHQALFSVFGFVGIIAAFFSSFIMILTMASIITTLSPFIIIVVVIVVGINAFVTKKVNYNGYLIDKEKDKYDIAQDSTRFMMSHIGFGQENRLFGLRSFLIDRYAESQREYNRLEYKATKNSMKTGACSAISGAAQQIILYSYSIYKVLNGTLAIGTMTIYMNAVGQLSGAFGSILTNYLHMSRNSLDIQDYIEFMGLGQQQQQSGNATPILTEQSIIEFKNVSFKYPGSERFAIQNLNLKIRCNEKLCIVGENGSGKSTFIKLLTRLYFPTNGEILLDGVNINCFDYEKYQQLFSPVFQKYCLYSLSFGQNIALSSEMDEEKLNHVCELSGLSELIKKLPRKYDTPLGKDVDPEGVETSGGEGQKIAIARALYHNSPFFILDEPTASLDPISEYDIYKNFHESIKDRGAILVTHRLSAVQLADKVAVFQDGAVVEYGTHTDLYAKNGTYKKMFDIQAKFYIDEARKQ